MITDLGRGTAYLAKGVHLVKDPDIRSYVVIPLSINILLFGGLIWFGFSMFSPLVDSIMAYVPGFLDFLEIFIWIFISLLTAFTIFFVFTPIANLIAAPFNALMSEKIEQKLTGAECTSEANIRELMINAVKSQLRKLLYIAIWSVALLLVSIIPLINFIAPFLWIVFGSWLLALEYMDYPMGNHDKTFDEQKQVLKSKRGLSLGFGLGTLVITSIPFINFFAIPIAVAGATALYVDHFSEEDSNGLKKLEQGL